MMDVAIIPIFGPFGRDQIVTTLTAGNPESGTAIGSYRRHHTSLVSGPHIAQKLTKKLDRFWNEKIAVLRSAPAIIFLF
jgi:hypothetical protein